MTGVPLKHLCSLPPAYGLNITPDRYGDEGVRLLRTSDIATGGVVRDAGGVFLNPADVPPELLLRDGDVLFSRSGTLGRALLYRQDQPGEATFAGFLVRFRLRDSVDPRAIRYWSESAEFIATVASEAIQSTISNFNADRYANLTVPEWLVSQSVEIADYLDAETAQIDAVVENRRQQVRLLGARRSSVVVQLATGGADGVANGLPIFPVDWARTRLRYLAQSPQAGDWGEDPTGVDDVFVVRAADFDRKRWRVDPARLPLRSIERSSFLQRRLRPGDLVLEKSGGGSDQPVGATASFDLDVRAVPSNFAARLRPADGIDGRFLCYALAATYEVGLNRRSIKQTTGIQNLDAGAYLSEAWAVPSYEQQVRIRAQIDAQLTEIDVLQDAAERQMRLLLERRQALITAAVAGQITIPGVAT